MAIPRLRVASLLALTGAMGAGGREGGYTTHTQTDIPTFYVPQRTRGTSGTPGGGLRRKMTAKLYRRLKRGGLLPKVASNG